MMVARLFSKIFKEGGVILIDHTGQKYICGNPRKENPITIKLLKRDLNWKLILDPELECPEAYMRNDLIIENASLKEFLMELCKNLGRDEVSSTGYISKKISQIWRFFTNYNLPGKSKKDIQHHYDIGGSKGEKLYDIFLDKKHRQYSCAYWTDETKTLEEAQQNKINHIIKKLDIKSGQKVLDVGCGWGGMAIEIAKSTGAKVKGITLSENQFKTASERAQKEGLSHKVTFALQDYRNESDHYDRIVSVGMFEHVGVKYFRTYLKKANDILKDNGVFLLHTIGQ